MEIVAEIGASHNGKLENALKLIKAAKDAGADCVKIQTFEPEEMAVPYTLKIGPWKGRDLIDLYWEAQTPKEWHETLFNYAHDLGIEIFSSPFSKNDVDFLETLNCPRYKIASPEAGDIELINHAANTGKPIIISAGYMTIEDMERIEDINIEDLTILDCVSKYPATYDDYRERWVTVYKHGISDHTLTMDLAENSKQEDMYERHIKLSGCEGLDSGFALDPEAFKQMVEILKGESLKRSLYYAEDLIEGTALEDRHFKTARPNLGCAPYKKHELIGTILTKSVKKNEPVKI